MSDIAAFQAACDKTAPCERCGHKKPRRTKRYRCRRCDKDTPPYGTPVWRAWTRGVWRTIKRRCVQADADLYLLTVANAVLFDEGEVPMHLAPLFADLVILPCSPGKYNALIESALNQIGLTMRTKPKVRVAVPTGVRIDLAEDDVEEEAEEAPARPRRRRMAAAT